MTNLLIATGPSGAGKSTLIQHIVSSNKQFYLSVSYTTRNPRPGETDGKDYHFITKEEFQQKLGTGFFLEHTLFNGNYYGTSIADFPKDSIIILDIDIKGLKYFKENYPEAYFCLLTADRESLKDRLIHRAALVDNVDRHTIYNPLYKEIEGRLTSFDDFEKARKSYEFNRIIKNSEALEDVLEEGNKLIEDVKNYYNL